eukprot:Pgem_evm1s10453
MRFLSKKIRRRSKDQGKNSKSVKDANGNNISNYENIVNESNLSGAVRAVNSEPCTGYYSCENGDDSDLNDLVVSAVNTENDVTVNNQVILNSDEFINCNTESGVSLGNRENINYINVYDDNLVTTVNNTA